MRILSELINEEGLLLDVYQKAECHRQWRGKLDFKSKVEITSAAELSIAYSPGVAQPCREIAKDKSKVFEYTGGATP